METMRITGRFAFCTMVTVAGLSLEALGCSVRGGKATTDTGGGGADAGHICTWDGTGGGITIPDCSAYRQAVRFVGTVSDMGQYDNTFTNTWTSYGKGPSDVRELEVHLGLDVLLHLEWSRPNVFGEWLDTTGTLQLPMDKPRALLPGSMIRLKCSQFFEQYILIVEGGELKACTAS